DRLVLRRRVDDDLLEAPLQRPVLLDVLAVLVQRRGADALDLAAGQGRLEDVGGVDGALGAAGADEGVQLVDEQDGVLGPADLVHDRLDALLELAAVLGAGDHHRQVEHDDALVAEQLRDVAVHDELGQALDDGGLADAGLAEQYGVVLGTARQHLNDALDFVGAANDGVEFTLTGQFGQVAAEAAQGGSLRLALPGLAFAPPAAAAALFRRHRIVPQQIQDFFPHVFQFQPQVHQDLGRHALLFAQQPEQQVLGADVVVIEVPRLLDGVLDDFFGPRRLGLFPHGDVLGA